MNDERIPTLLRDAIDTADPELKRDLWLAMRTRLDARKRLRVSMFDWALIAAAITWAIIFPNAAIALLYHL
jgi:hypothetical protein